MTSNLIAPHRLDAFGTGGTITTAAGYTYHTFTSSGTFTMVGSKPCDLLCVGGGAPGGSGARSNVNNGYSGGGGGAGQVITSLAVALSGPYTCTVGAASQQSTIVGLLTAGTGTAGVAGLGGVAPLAGAGGRSNTYVPAQLFAGGTSWGTGGGGGAGSGGAGPNADGSTTTAGGVGTTVWTVTYGVGGEAYCLASTPYGPPGTSGASNSGNGGGAGRDDVIAAGAGGSGVVVIRYLT